MGDPQGAPGADTISMVHNQFLEEENYPIIKGIEGGKRCLPCGMASEPQLQLEDKEIATISRSQSDAIRFTFFNTPQGNTHHFQSASQKNNGLVSLTNQLGQVNNTHFYFNHKN